LVVNFVCGYNNLLTTGIKIVFIESN